MSEMLKSQTLNPKPLGVFLLMFSIVTFHLANGPEDMTFTNQSMIIHVGDSMSKVWEKRSMSKSGFFWWNVKDNRQKDDFGRFLNNFCNFWVFLANNPKYPKMTVWKKWKLKKVFFLSFFLNIQQLISRIIYIILIVWIL